MIPQLLARRMFSCRSTGRGAVYEVSIRFSDASVKADYYKWLTSSHIQEVLKYDGFISAELLEEFPGPDGFLLRYFLESESVFTKYDSSEDAKRLRLQGIERFGNSFSATRRVLLSRDVFFR